MAPKRPSPLDEPPTASSSSEEEQADDDGDEVASSEEDEPPKPSSAKPPSKKPPPPLNSAPSSESESDSDSGSDSGHRWVANPRVKPIASKPMQETPPPKPKKPPASSARSTAKPPAENNVSRQPNDSKRTKKRESGVATDVEVPAKEDHRKNGEDLHFIKSRQKKSLEGADKAKSSGKVKKDQKEGGGAVASLNSKQQVEQVEKMDIDKPSGSMLSLSEMIRFDESVGLPGLSEDVIKRGLELIGASKRAELEKRWKDLQVAELDLYVKCAELISDQAKLISQAYKSSNH